MWIVGQLATVSSYQVIPYQIRFICQTGPLYISAQIIVRNMQHKDYPVVVICYLFFPKSLTLYAHESPLDNYCNVCMPLYTILWTQQLHISTALKRFTIKSSCMSGASFFYRFIYYCIYRIVVVLYPPPYSHWLLFESLVYIRKHFFPFLFLISTNVNIPFFHTINEGFACLRLLIYVMFENIKRNCFSIFPPHFTYSRLIWSWLIILYRKAYISYIHS